MTTTSGPAASTPHRCGLVFIEADGPSVECVRPGRFHLVHHTLLSGERFVRLPGFGAWFWDAPRPARGGADRP